VHCSPTNDGTLSHLLQNVLTNNHIFRSSSFKLCKKFAVVNDNAELAAVLVVAKVVVLAGRVVLKTVVGVGFSATSKFQCFYFIGFHL